MAKIWLVKSGESGGKLATEKPLGFCCATLGLRLEDWVGPRAQTIGSKEDPHKAPSLGLRYTMVEVTQDDVTPDQSEWQPGYYLLDKDATEVRKLLEIY